MYNLTEKKKRMEASAQMFNHCYESTWDILTPTFPLYMIENAGGNCNIIELI